MDADQLWLSEGWTYISGRRGVPGWPDGEEVIVAVIDTGVDGAHRDLGANVLQVGDACHRTPSHPHGTHVAGIIAAVAGNRQDVAGIAPQAKILPIKVHFYDDFGDPEKKTNPADPTCFGLVPTLTTAIDAARRDGADVINLSLRWNRRERDRDFVVSQVGVDAADEAPHVGRDTVEWAIEVARLQGVVVVAAAGNCGDDSVWTLDGVPQEGFKHNRCTSHNQPQVPAGYWNVIAVAATDSADVRSAASTANGDVEIAAPGDDILSTVPAYVDDGSGPCGAGVTCHVAEYSGTSMAAPMVAAVAAHMKARYGDIDPGLVTDAIFSTARAAPGVAAGSVTHEYGAGIIDPAAALEALDRRLGTPLPPPPLPEVIPGGSDQAAITIAAGADAQGALGPNGTPCTSVDCRYVEITLTNVPTGDYTVECFTSANPTQPWLTATWHWPNDTQWTHGGCAYDTPGHQIWITVTNPHGSLTTNPITWPTTTPPSPQPPDTAPTPPPTEVTGPWRAVAVGEHHSCALNTAGHIKCWGSNRSGETDAPEGVYTAIAAAFDSCALRADGTVTCWGAGSSENRNRYLSTLANFTSLSVGGNGCGVTTDRSILCWGPSSVLDGVPDGDFTAVTIHRDLACGLRTDGTVTCWGDNIQSSVQTSGPIGAPAGTFTAVSAGTGYACGLRTDGTVTCWGPNTVEAPEAPTGTFTALGGSGTTCGLHANNTLSCWSCTLRSDNTFECSELGHPSGTFAAVTSSYGHRCALRTDATITCWGGYNQFGEIEAPGSTFTAVTSGRSHACGLHSDAHITCWGYGPEGPIDAPGGTFTAVAAGAHSCGVRDDATITCWGGYNQFGEIEAPGSTFTAVASGVLHSCGVRDDATITCWGWNEWGQAEAPGGTFTAVAAGWGHSCGLRTNATISCWGWNSEGQTDAPGGTFTAISASEKSSCGLRTDGTITCWGWDYDRQAEAPAGTFTAVAAGSDHSCGLRDNGTITCRGYGGSTTGEAEDPSRNSPVPSSFYARHEGFTVGEMEEPAGTFTAISAGPWYSCGLDSDGTITCWGEVQWGWMSSDELVPHVTMVDISPEGGG